MEKYNKTDWYSGKLIVADDLNNIEEGIDNINSQINDINNALDTKIDDGYVEDGVAYFESNGQVLFTITGIGGGGGGGGGPDNPAVMTIANGMPWLSTTIAEGANCPITFNWTSTVNDIPTGNGSVKIIVNNVSCGIFNVAQGDVTLDVGSYLKSGINSVRFTVSDAYSNTKSIIYTITAITVSLSSTFDTSVIYNDSFVFPYTPMGAVEKTVHVKLDGIEQETFTTTASNRQLSYQVPVQTHGGHSIEMWFTAEVSGDTLTSNHIYYEYLYVVEGQTTAIIISSYNKTDITQYNIEVIPYRVYNPVALQNEIQIKEDNVVKQIITVGRTEQTYSYRPYESGTHTVTISAGAISRTFTFNVEAVDINVQAETEGLILYLNAAGRSNQASNRRSWVYEDIYATLSNFNWTSDGWLPDADGAIALRVRDDARVSIPFKLFGSDFRSTGYTIEFEFATHEVRNYDTSIISCMQGSPRAIGLNITSQMASLTSIASYISTQFKEDEHVRISYVIEQREGSRLIYCYINGISSGVVQYPTTDIFQQSEPVNISLGCSDATLDIYNIRVYNHPLSHTQIVNNWIADTQNGLLLVERYARNNIFDEYGRIVIEKLPNDLPYMILEGDLPQYKGDKKIVRGQYVNPINTAKSFIFEDAQIDVQGTSSQYYTRKNYKIKRSEEHTSELQSRI